MKVGGCAVHTSLLAIGARGFGIAGHELGLLAPLLCSFVGLPQTPPDVGVLRIGSEPALESAFCGFVVLELDEYIGKTERQADGLVALAQLEELLQGAAGALQIAFALVEACQRFERTSVTRV